MQASLPDNRPIYATMPPGKYRSIHRVPGVRGFVLAPFLKRDESLVTRAWERWHFGIGVASANCRNAPVQSETDQPRMDTHSLEAGRGMAGLAMPAASDINGSVSRLSEPAHTTAHLCPWVRPFGIRALKPTLARRAKKAIEKGELDSFDFRGSSPVGGW